MVKFLRMKKGRRNIEYPERYTEYWQGPFDYQVEKILSPGISILDVGSGRKPTIPIGQRPVNCYYTGLDLSHEELQKAEPNAYDSIYISDVVDRIHELEGKFDLIVSWDVLEHVKPLDNAIGNLKTYLKTGGFLVAHFSASFSVFGIINQLLPHQINVWALKTLLGRDPETVFPAHYHHCWYTALERLFCSWSYFKIQPRYRGAVYLDFSKLLQRIYLIYENWAFQGKHYNLATHYLVTATR